MADTNTKPQSASIKSIMAGGVWRSRRVVAAVAIAAGITFGFAGTQIQQADASIGWCRSCIPNAAPGKQFGQLNAKAVYTVRGTVYSSAS
jgi:hypothetical protein